MNNVQSLEMLKKKSRSKRGTWRVILHDDNNITFDHVINCLIDYCSHNEFQAHQCALITHNKKRCAVFVDSYVVCESVRELLTEQGLTVTLEKDDKHNSKS